MQQVLFPAGYVSCVRPIHCRRGGVGRLIFILKDSVARPAHEMVIVYCYGVSAEVNGHLFVFNLVNWSVGVARDDNNTVARVL